jgi:hypothetical protein
MFVKYMGTKFDKPPRRVPKHNVTCMPITRQRLDKHIPVRKNGTSLARQQIGKHASLTIEVVFFVGSVQSGYKEVFSRTEESSS